MYKFYSAKTEWQISPKYKIALDVNKHMINFLIQLDGNGYSPKFD